MKSWAATGVTSERFPLTRLHILSDLHLEFAQYRAATADADVIVLAGDIDRGTRGLEWARGSFPHRAIVYVAGNHEYYGKALPKLTDDLRARAATLDIAFLENDAIDVAGCRFLGCTLWTDLQLLGSHPRVVDAVLNVMVDYRAIRVSPLYRRLRPADTIGLHRRSVGWLRQFNGQLPSPTVVLTHHAPSAQSIAPQDAEDPVSAAYASHLDALVADLGAAVWIHGHTHHCVDYMVGPTRVVSNQRGYPGEDTGFVPHLIIDV